MSQNLNSAIYTEIFVRAARQVNPDLVITPEDEQRLQKQIEAASDSRARQQAIHDWLDSLRPPQEAQS